jgi:hypothetical protein
MYNLMVLFSMSAKELKGASMNMRVFYFKQQIHICSDSFRPFIGSGDRLVPTAQSVAASLEWLASIRRVPVRDTAGMCGETPPHT